MEKFETCLLQVQKANPDEYSQISDILQRYETLSKSNKELKSQQMIQKEIEKKQEEIIQCDKD